MAGPIVAGLFFGLAAVGANAQGVFELKGQSLNSTQDVVILRDREVSAANAAQTWTYDIGDISQVLAIVAVCSAGTATLTVTGSFDDANFVTIDSAVAASTNVKLYNNSTAGATTAVSPLAFRWVTISVGTCGASNTSTLTVGGK
jgi:hypothetical protein